jgi:two-component sensor histidine kinase/predicted hydrocarbon binding protein
MDKNWPPKGNTVTVPKEMKPLFDKAQKTVGNYFLDLYHEPEKGTIEIQDQRYVLVRASALSYDFLNTIQKLYADRGEEEANSIGRNFLFDIAHVIGLEDAKNFNKKMKVKDPVAKLSAGPVHFAYSGWAFVDILPESKPSPDENFFLKYNHPFSFEADSWLRVGKKSDQPVCVMNAGYSSGWCEASFGMSLTAVEITCKARGDKNCTFIMAPPHKIESYLGKQKNNTDRKKTQIPSFLERKKIEEGVKNSLKEKEILLKEIHHRVKNNLQIISSLLNLQSLTLEDKQSREKFKESINRIKSMAIIHEMLYRSGNLSVVKIKDYFESLISFISGTYTVSTKIKTELIIKSESEVLDIDKAIPCGLILNEMISNSLKYAFKDRKSGKIGIRFNEFPKKEKKYELIVEDDGVGISKNFDFLNVESFGMQIVHSLVSQLDGSITLENKSGTKFSIQF